MSFAFNKIGILTSGGDAPGINDLTNPYALAHLLKYDSTHWALPIVSSYIIGTTKSAIVCFYKC